MAIINGVDQATRQIVDWNAYNQVNSDRPRNPDGSVRGGNDLAVGGPITANNSSAANSGDVSGDMTPNMINSLTQSMNAAGTGAYNQSILTGFVMKPTFDQDGNWKFEYQLDANGQRIPTIASQLTQAQIEDMAAKTALQAHIAAGVVRDPSTGQWVKTPEAIRLDLQGKLNDAQIAQIDADIKLNQEKLASANAQFDKDLAFRTQQQLDKLAIDREQMAQQAAQFNVTASGYMANGANTLDRDKLLEQGREFDQNLDFQKAVELANAVSDPTRLVQGAALANIWGGSRGGTMMQNTASGQAIGVTDPNFNPNAGQDRSIAAQADQDVPGAFATGLNGAVDQAQNMVNQVSATNPLVAVSPEINNTLAGNVNPAFGNPTGVQGSMQPLNTITPTSQDFAKIVPAAFASLTPTGQKQYQALAMARQPGLKPEDLVKNIRAQMPTGSSGFVPAAFMLR